MRGFIIRRYVAPSGLGQSLKLSDRKMQAEIIKSKLVRQFPKFQVFRSLGDWIDQVGPTTD